MIKALFDKGFWIYLLSPKDRDISWIKVIICRYRGHPKGPIWFTTYRLEPDMHCKNCGDNIG